METTISGTRDALVQDVQKLKGNVSQITQDAKAHAGAHVDEARKRFNDALAAAQAQLSSHPLTVLGIGVVLGYLFGRRGRRRAS